jgi:hypothetical protein
VELAPNLDLIPKVNDSYLQMYAEETDPRAKRRHPEGAPEFSARRRLFSLRKQPHGRGAKWYNYLGEKYPDKPIIDNEPDSLPKNMTLDEYAVAVVQIDIGETSQERVTSAVQGLLTHAYIDLAIGQDDRAAGFKLLAGKVYANYQKRWAGNEPAHRCRRSRPQPHCA